MHHGFVSVAAATPALRVADCGYNVRQITAMRQTAIENNASLLLLPALCITGATCGDLFFQYSLLEAAVEGLLTLCEAGANDDLLTFAGLPLPLDGKLYHCVAALHRGAILGIVPERNPRDTRHFAPADISRTTLTVEGVNVPFGTDLLFACSGVPSLVTGIAFSSRETQPLASGGATLLLYPDAQPSYVGRYVKERSLWLSQSAINHTAALHACAGLGEAAREGVFSGHGLVIENGKLLAEAPRFSTSLAVSEIDLERLENERRRDPGFSMQPSGQVRVSFSFDKRETPLTRAIPRLPFVPEYAPDWAAHCEEAFLMAAHALAGRIRLTEPEKLVLGLSGSLDSTLAALTAANAMSLLDRPSSEVIAVFTPGYTTGARTSTNALQTGKLLGFTPREVDIRQLVVQHMDAIGHESRDDSVFENTHSRERTRILLDIAEQQNGLLIGSRDLSDMALGRYTFGGSQTAHFAVNGDIPKTLARAMLQYAAELASDELRDVLRDIIETPIPSERMPQPGEEHSGDALGPFELHDFFLFYTVRWGFPPDKLLRMARHAFADRYSAQDLERVLKIFYTRFFEVGQSRASWPDIARLGSVSLAEGYFRTPVEARGTVWLDAGTDMTGPQPRDDG